MSLLRKLVALRLEERLFLGFASDLSFEHGLSLLMLKLLISTDSVP